MFMGKHSATLQRIMPVFTHGQKNVRVQFELDSAPGQAQQAQFAAESFDETLIPGDTVEVHFVAGVAIEIKK